MNSLLGWAGLVLAVAATRADKTITMVGMTGPNETSIVVATTEARVAALPVWHPEEGQPAPIDLRLVIDLGRDSIRKRHPDVGEFSVRSVKMERFDAPYGDRWYYLVEFLPVIEGRAMRGGLYYSCVLTDGSVIEPKERTGKSGDK